MIPLTIAEVAKAVHGKVHHKSGLDDWTEVSGDVVIDSREVKSGDLFFAIAGENFDGHDFVEQALGAGAVAAVVSKHVPGLRTIEVDDTAAALGRLAKEVLNRAFRIQVFAITGSSGKTTTKDLLAQVLAEEGPTVAAVGSQNNELGLPLTVLRITRDTRFLVLEMGARGRGHIKTLTDIAQPDVAIVLNVGSAHLGEFGSADEIAAAKAELVEALSANGVAILNADDDRVSAMRHKTTAEVMTFGVLEGSTIQIKHVELDDHGRPKMRLSGASMSIELHLSIHGAHQALNATAVAVAALVADIPAYRAGRVLSAAKLASRWRMEVSDLADGTVLINDSYNANPESVAAGLHALAAMGKDRPKWAVLGEMRELGETSTEAHREVGRLTQELGVEGLIVVGEGALGIEQGARNAGLEQVTAVANADDAAAALIEQAPAGSTVLIKASRAIGLERVAELFTAERGLAEGDSA